PEACQAVIARHLISEFVNQGFRYVYGNPIRRLMLRLTPPARCLCVLPYTLTDGEKEKRAEKEALKMENALNSIRQWRFPLDTEWARDTLLRLVSGTLQYELLPCKGQE
ncbi:unnamed protein product, partial [Clonostachys solani]